MAKQKTALIYERIVAITPERHRKTFVDIGSDWRFAAGLDAVPMLSEEFASIARFCPIVFAGSEKSLLPHAMLGLKPGKSIFVGENGGWGGPYIPAFLRRYPFISAPVRQKENDTADKRILAIDEDFKGVNTSGRGMALYDAQGAQTKFLQDVGKFVVNFDVSLGRTRAFVGRLQEQDLLEPMAIQITDKSGTVTGGIGGMFGVSKKRLDAMEGDVRARLEEAGDLERCGLHLQSLSHIRRAAPGVRPPAQTAQN